MGTNSIALEKREPTPIRSLLSQAAEQSGLIFLGVAPLSYASDYERFENQLLLQPEGLKYLEKFSEVRRNPENLLPGAKCAVVVALPYFREKSGDGPTVALYAQGDDYHRVLKQRSHPIVAKLEELFPGSRHRIIVDTAPVLERALASQTARGFIGKNTLFIHPEYGSFLLLAEVFTTADLKVDPAASVPLDRKTKAGGCGPCKQCQVACPTGALDSSYRLDAGKCLAYWTIEHRSTIPETYWPWLGKYYFGCDLCQNACPYNLKAAMAPPDWKQRHFPPIDTVAMLSQAEYEKYFGGTPLTRAKREGLRRNALIAMAVTNHRGLGKALAHIDQDGGFPLKETREQIVRWKQIPSETVL